LISIFDSVATQRVTGAATDRRLLPAHRDIAPRVERPTLAPRMCARPRVMAALALIMNADIVVCVSW
jgi:hypothetical protein